MRDKPWAGFGQDFERRVVARLARQTSVLLPPAGEIGLMERQALPFLRGNADVADAAQVNAVLRGAACGRQGGAEVVEADGQIEGERAEHFRIFGNEIGDHADREPQQQ